MALAAVGGTLALALAQSRPVANVELRVWMPRRRNTKMARRIVALRELAREADAHFHAAEAAPLELP